jgi:hypothetical protein
VPAFSDSVAQALTRFRAGADPLSERLQPQHQLGPVRFVRIGEYLQRDQEALAAIDGAGIRPGMMIEADCDGTRLTLKGETGECDLDADWADQVFVGG